MDRQEAFDLLCRYLDEQHLIPAEKITMKSHFFRDFDLDSIDALDMVGMLEIELDITIEEEEIKKIRTVGDVVDFITQNAH